MGTSILEERDATTYRVDILLNYTALHLRKTILLTTYGTPQMLHQNALTH